MKGKIFPSAVSLVSGLLPEEAPIVRADLPHQSNNQDTSGEVPYSMTLICVASTTETNHNNYQGTSQSQPMNVVLV